MSPETIERPRTAGPGDALGGGWRVIVLNDDHNTFDGVAGALARVIPGVTRAELHTGLKRSSVRVDGGLVP